MSFFYKLTLAYDGTDYFGWQEQPDKKTVAGTILATYKRVFKTDAVIYGSSRTDAGVHAHEQVARLRTEVPMENGNLMRVLNQSLPPDIAITSIETCDATYHPHAHVLRKTYLYRLTNKKPNPECSRFVHWYRHPFDQKVFAQALMLFVGTHDFRSFCTGDEMESTICTVEKIIITHDPTFDGLAIHVIGPRFVRYMVRRMVGAALSIATDPARSIDEIPQALAARNPHQLFLTAAPEGLMLMKIEYSKL